MAWMITSGESRGSVRVASVEESIIQGPLISQRIVDNRDVSESDLERMLDMTVRALGADGIDHD